MTKTLFKQIIKFGIVGGICFFVDYGLMVGLTELFHVYYLLSSMISFTVSVIVNYSLSMRFVFASKAEGNKRLEFLFFVILSLIGLGLNQVLMWFFVTWCDIFYMIAKIGVTAIVMVYNFVTRKLLLEKKEK